MTVFKSDLRNVYSKEMIRVNDEEANQQPLVHPYLSIQEFANYFNVLLLADPQISDDYTNQHLPRILSRTLDWFSDQFIRRAYTALVRGNAAMKDGKDAIHAVIWMGDITDGGRREQTVDQ